MKNKKKKIPRTGLRDRTSTRVDRFFNYIDSAIRRRISSNIQLELIFAVALCLIVGFIGYNITYLITHRVEETPYISYEQGIYDIRESAYDIAERMINDLRYKEEAEITEDMRQNIRYAAENNPAAKQFDLNRALGNLIEDFSRVENLRVIVTDLEGNIQFKTTNVTENSLDIFNVMKNSFEVSYSGNNDYYHLPDMAEVDSAEEVTLVYPMNFLKEDRYLIVKGTPVASMDTSFRNVYNPSLSLFVALVLFIVLFLFLTRRKMDYIQQLSDTVRIISTGNFKYKAPVRGNDELTNLAKSINSMATDIDERIEEERKVEQMKSDLITNVSHDLRTPLTSIIGYIGLAQTEGLPEDKRKEYIGIVSSKALRLKELIESLFEFSKLQSPENKLTILNVNLRELLEQLVEEMIPIAEENGLTLVKELPKSDVVIQADVQQVVRLFENLISNAIKYSSDKNPISITLHPANPGHMVLITFENSIGDIPDEDIPKMFERFYRLDKSRFSETGGSGLGLAIAENIVKMHSGRIHAKKTARGTLMITVELPSRYYSR